MEPRTALVISPHADDAAAFCGGTLAKLILQGWRVVLLRVTDDSKDSIALSIPETIRRNTEELQQACGILGIEQVVELGFETDGLADIPLGRLRERIVYWFRRLKPFAVFTFDPFGLYENNQDHIRVAQAVDEAFWVSCFDKHYPEHFQEGLDPFSVCERWYFARSLERCDTFEDVTATLDQKMRAVCAHREMMRNTIQQSILQLKTLGRQVPILNSALEGDLQPLVGMALLAQASAAASQAGWIETRLAEGFRKVRFGDFEELFQSQSEPLAEQ